MERPVIPWGWPAEAITDGEDWFSQYGSWLLVGGLILAALMAGSSQGSKTRKKRGKK